MDFLSSSASKHQTCEASFFSPGAPFFLLPFSLPIPLPSLSSRASVSLSNHLPYIPQPLLVGKEKATHSEKQMSAQHPALSPPCIPAPSFIPEAPVVPDSSWVLSESFLASPSPRKPSQGLRPLRTHHNHYPSPGFFHLEDAPCRYIGTDFL